MSDLASAKNDSLLFDTSPNMSDKVVTRFNETAPIGAQMIHPHLQPIQTCPNFIEFSKTIRNSPNESLSNKTLTNSKIKKLF